jgi:hypothetical protein
MNAVSELMMLFCCKLPNRLWSEPNPVGKQRRSRPPLVGLLLKAHVTSDPGRLFSLMGLA